MIRAGLPDDVRACRPEIVVDIDIYHTSRDKSAYSHGMFWHTYHYGDADDVDAPDISTARGREGFTGVARLPGHNYTTGWSSITF